MTVTIVSCVYGDTHKRFISEWQESIRALDPRPSEVIVLSDRHYELSVGQVFPVLECTWKHPQAFYLQRAMALVLTPWAWFLDIDDTALPDALQGIDEVNADVWQMGYERSDGETHIPPALDAREYLAEHRNLFTAGSAVRTDIFNEAGGFPDIAFQDWGLWRRLAARGARFQSSGRTHYRYNRHAATRSETELTTATRSRDLEEMYALA